MNVAVRAEHLNIISLCTGGGGLDLGVELAMPSARSVVLVEREAFSASHLVAAMQEGLMAPAPIWSDVTTFNGRPWRGLVDGLIGGIPCQPHSLAGKRGGEDDERDLWSDARRIIVQSGAWFVLIENVRGMLSARPGLDPGALRVWRDLRRLGFSVEAGLFTATEVGAPHERERIFILGVANPTRDFRRGQLEPGGARRWRSGSAGTRSELADAGRERDERRRRTGDVLCSTSPCEGQGDQWHGNAPDDRGHDMADAVSAGLERIEPGRDARQGVERSAAQRNGSALAHAHVIELRREPPARQQPLLQSDDGIRERYLFPPGPSDFPGWREALERAPELEPAVRRMVDGVATKVDAARIDELRMLGNGVVSLEAAYALRTLVTRLAAAGAPGAARLVRQLWDGAMSAHPTPAVSPQQRTDGAP